MNVSATQLAVFSASFLPTSSMFGLMLGLFEAVFYPLREKCTLVMGFYARVTLLCMFLMNYLVSLYAAVSRSKDPWVNPIRFETNPLTRFLFLQMLIIIITIPLMGLLPLSRPTTCFDDDSTSGGASTITWWFMLYFGVSAFPAIVVILSNLTNFRYGREPDESLTEMIKLNRIEL